MRANVFIVPLIAASSAIAQPGTLDPSFNADGIATIDVGAATFDDARALAIQPDGAIIAAGTSGYSGTQDFAVVRCLDNGDPDPSFGVNGRALISIDAGDDIARAVALQDDGRIVLGGYTYGSLGIGFALARLNTDGSPDTTFGSGGIVTTITPGDVTLQALAVAVQADGRIVLAGGGSAGFAIMRYTSGGDPDSTFGVNGLATVDFSQGNDQATAMAIRPDGRILLSGYASGLTQDSIALASLMPDGSMDPSFGSGGKKRVSYPTLPSIGLGLDLMADGRFVVCGYANSSSIVGRFMPDGSMDNSFNVFGWKLLSFSGTVGSKLYGVHVQADGRIALGGIGYGAQPQFLILNLDDDGSYDTGFGTGGFTLTDINALEDDAYALAAQADGKLVLAGRTDGGINDLDFALARYAPDLTVVVEEHSSTGRQPRVFPLPLMESATLAFTLERADIITIELLDAAGRCVDRAVNGAPRTAGDLHEVIDVPLDLPQGVYVLRVRGARTDLRVKAVR